MSSITCSIIIQIIIGISIIGFILKKFGVNDKTGCLAIIIFCIIPIPTWLGLPITLWLAKLIETFGNWFDSNAGCIIIPILLLTIFLGLKQTFEDIKNDDSTYPTFSRILKTFEKNNDKENLFQNDREFIVTKESKNDINNQNNKIFTEQNAKELISKSENNSQIIIPEEFTSIENDTFYGNSFLTIIEIANSITSIGNNAFTDCSSLKNINIPDSVTSIGNFAFGRCKSLKSITIPDSVKRIGNNAFFGIDTVYYNGTAKGSPWGANQHIKK